MCVKRTKGGDCDNNCVEMVHTSSYFLGDRATVLYTDQLDSGRVGKNKKDMPCMKEAFEA